MTATVFEFAGAVNKNQMALLVDCDYDGRLDIHSDRVVSLIYSDSEDEEQWEDARSTLAHLVGTAIDQAESAIEDGDDGTYYDSDVGRVCRVAANDPANVLARLHTLRRTVGLTEEEVA